MAKNKKNNLIGYDPLARMEGDVADVNKTEGQSVTDGIDSAVNLEEQPADTQIEIIDDYPSDLLDNAQESEISNKIEIEHNSDVVEKNTEDLAADNAGKSQIDLAPTLAIQHVESLYEKLKASLAAHDQIEINASDVVSIDTSTLQLLVSLKKEAVKLQKKVTIIYPSPRFVESAQLLGLSDILEVHA
jgi:ABC-type transporter Mla MlaB component